MFKVSYIPHRLVSGMLLLTMLFVPGAVCRAGVVGDANGDGHVGIADVTKMVKTLQRILIGTTSVKATTVALRRCDVNADGVVNQADLDAVVAILLGRERTYGTAEYIETYGTHDYVDLGLSVKWATCNLGATAPYEVGYYYSWGELTPKTDYTEAGYEFYENSTYKSIGSNLCGGVHDAATAAWGSDWRLPTTIDVNQLLNKCTWTATTQEGQAGYLVTGPNGNSIFLPMTGCLQVEAPGSDVTQYLTDGDTSMYYWSGMSSSSTSSSAYCLNNSGYSGAWAASRAYGFPIRPVHK